jgi:hypothetical protein
MENKKIQVMKRSERGAIDKALSGAINQGEDAEAILKRMYGDIPLEKLSDDQVYSLLDKASELTGHLGLEKHGISDADPKAVQKLLKKEYGFVEDIVPAIISEQDPEKFVKKYNKASKLGYADPKYLEDIMSGNSMGLEIPGYEQKSGLMIPKTIATSPQGNPLRQAGVGLHEMEHGVDDIVGDYESRPYKWDAVAEARKGKQSPFEALRGITKGHHAGRDNFELEKANELIKGSSQLDDASKSAIRKRAQDIAEKMFGKGYTKVRAVAPILGGAAGLAASAAAEAFDAESAGEGSDQVFSPEQKQSVEASRQLSAGEPMNQQRFQALQKMVRGR